MKRVLGLLGEERTTEGFTTAKKISTANDAIKIEKESVLKKFLNALVLVHILIIVWPFDMYLKIRVMKPAWFLVLITHSPPMFVYMDETCSSPEKL